MRLSKIQLKTIKIFNPHNIMRICNNKLYVDYTGVDNTRGGHGAYWKVIGNGFNTAPESKSYHDNYCKTFLIWDRTHKEEKLQEALAWVKETYGITEFERDSFGCYQIKGSMAKLSKIFKDKSLQEEK
jgi:hypothetical protein